MITASASSDITKLRRVFSRKSLDPHTRVIAGDTLRYNLVRDEQIEEAEKVAKEIIRIGTPYQADPLFDIKKRAEVYDALERAYITLAPNDFHTYLIALEWNRPVQDRFYQPRMKVLRPIVDDLTDMMVRDRYDIYGLSTPPRIGKTSLSIFFISWLIGRNCSSPILGVSYAEKITKMFHNGLLEIYNDPVTYNYRNIFPQLALVDSSAKDLTLDFRDDGGKATRTYKSFTARSIDGQLTGATEARQLLYVDDLVEDIEEALSKDRLDTLSSKLIANAQSRKKEGCKELHIGTRWSIHDPLTRLERRHDDNPRAKFVRIPALDPETDESNFDYPYNVGFSTDYYKTLREDYIEKNDSITWECVYQQNPIEREGLLFPADELTYVTALPPLEGEHGPDDRYAFCDVAFGGNDFLSMPVAYQWGDAPPIIIDVVFVQGDYKHTEPLVSGTLINRKVARAVFEANNGGDFYAKDITGILKEAGYPCFIVARRAESNKSKETRIVQYSPDIKGFLFLDPKSDLATPMYRQFMSQLTTYTLNGKNRNDDAPDSLAGLAAMQRTNLNAKVQVFDRKYI